jgi:hypothetical protein
MFSLKQFNIFKQLKKYFVSTTRNLQEHTKAFNAKLKVGHYAMKGKCSHYPKAHYGKCAQFGAAANWRSMVKNVFGAAIISPLSN